MISPYTEATRVGGGVRGYREMEESNVMARKCQPGPRRASDRGHRRADSSSERNSVPGPQMRGTGGTLKLIRAEGHWSPPAPGSVGDRLLLFEDQSDGHGLSFGVGSAGFHGQGLAACGDNHPAVSAVFGAAVLRFIGEGVGVDLLDGDGVVWCSLAGDGCGRSIELCRIAAVDGGAASGFAGGGDLDSVGIGFSRLGEALHGKRAGRVFAFFGIQLPGSEGVVSSKGGG
jgi:hypothetical protein